VQWMPWYAYLMDRVNVVRVAGIAVAIGSRRPRPPRRAGKWMIGVVWRGNKSCFVIAAIALWMIMRSCNVVEECQWWISCVMFCVKVWYTCVASKCWTDGIMQFFKMATCVWRS
jgi:hypothetical protein